MEASSPGRQNTRQQQAATRRQQILEAAVRLFARQGVARTTTRQIAKEVGVTEGLIFKYFPTKLELVRAVTGSPHIILGDLRGMLRDAKGQPAADVMGRVATTWLDLLHREVDLSSILFGEALINPEIGDILDHVIEEGAAYVEQFLDVRKQTGEITTLADTKTIAHMYMASILIFFIRNRRLSEKAWEKESALFASHLKAAWLRMVTP